MANTDARPRYDAILFDLLTGLLDSWTLWDMVADSVGLAAGSRAGSVGASSLGRTWRRTYLEITFASTGGYRPYEDFVLEAARASGAGEAAAKMLIARWGELAPWPEAREVLAGLRGRGAKLGVVTNCSQELGLRAVAALKADFDVVLTAERAGVYKPDPRVYQHALRELGTTPGRTLFVAGSPGDVLGASRVGMPVFWHNRAGLPPASRQAEVRPLATAASLEPVLALLSSSEDGAPCSNG